MRNRRLIFLFPTLPLFKVRKPQPSRFLGLALLMEQLDLNAVIAHLWLNS